MLIDKEIKSGIPSYCTGNQYVIQSLLRIYKNKQRPLLLEATANQVNQFGGYTGKTPLQFKAETTCIAKQMGFDVSRLIFGGDHLGPLVWRNSSAEEAMDKAEDLVRDFVKAGYKKIHLDTSMQLGEESKEKILSVETIAKRGLRLYRACQSALSPGEKCIYVIGSEVPFPGGETECDKMTVTHPRDAISTISIYKKIFKEGGVSESEFDENISAMVVQPGVEFTREKVFHYCHENAKELISIERGTLVFEGHSTDYQHPNSLHQMVKDGVKILKVGPELTFIFRATLERLETFEKEIIEAEEQSQFGQILLNAMNKDPKYWVGYYSAGNAYDFRFSYLDRSRYYLTKPEVLTAIEKLKSNVDGYNNSAILFKYFPELSDEDIKNNLFELVVDKALGSVVEKYENAFL